MLFRDLIMIVMLSSTAQAAGMWSSCFGLCGGSKANVKAFDAYNLPPSFDRQAGNLVQKSGKGSSNLAQNTLITANKPNRPPILNVDNSHPTIASNSILSPKLIASPGDSPSSTLQPNSPGTSNANRQLNSGSSFVEKSQPAFSMSLNSKVDASGKPQYATNPSGANVQLSGSGFTSVNSQKPGSAQRSSSQEQDLLTSYDQKPLSPYQKAIKENPLFSPSLASFLAGRAKQQGPLAH